MNNRLNSTYNFIDQEIHPQMSLFHDKFSPNDMKRFRTMVFGHKTEYRLRLRATIVWCHFRIGLTVTQIAIRLQVSTKTVRKWLQRFREQGLNGLLDLPRSGAPVKFTLNQRLEVMAIACDRPVFYGFVSQPLWTLDTLTYAANESIPDISISRSSVARVLTQNTLKPHRMQMWLHSPDPQFREKVNDIVELYLNPPADAIVLCVDEKTGIQATERKYETVRPWPGRLGRYEHEYIRHGTQSLTAAFDIRTGDVTASCTQHRKAEDLLAFMECVVEKYADWKRIIVIWDNLNTHYDGPDDRWTEFNAKHGGKLEFHYTPIHASWVNQVEIFFSILQRKCLRYGDFFSVEDLSNKIMAFIEQWNRFDGHPFNWTFCGYRVKDRKVA
jgi:transposase